MEEKGLGKIEPFSQIGNLDEIARLIAVHQANLENLLSDKHKWERSHDKLVDDDFYIEAYKKLGPCKLVKQESGVVVRKKEKGDFDDVRQFLKRTGYDKFISLGFILSSLTGERVYKEVNYYLENDKGEKILVKSGNLEPDIWECESLLKFGPNDVVWEEFTYTRTKVGSIMWRSEVKVKVTTRTAYLKNSKGEYLMDDNGKKLVVQYYESESVCGGD